MVVYDTYDDEEKKPKYKSEEYYERQQRKELNKQGAKKSSNKSRSKKIKEDIEEKEAQMLRDNPDLVSAKTKLIEKRQERKKHIKLILCVCAIFIVLFTISFRNSQIAEKFSQIKGLKSDLALINKENEQLEVNIESSLNLNNIEKLAKENLGMQKQTGAQTVYISLPTQDYIEPAKEDNNVKEKKWYQEFWEYITNLL